MTVSKAMRAALAAGVCIAGPQVFAAVAAGNAAASARQVRLGAAPAKVVLSLADVHFAADGHTQLILRLDDIRTRRSPGVLYRLTFGPRDDEFVGYFNLYDARPGERREFDATAAFAAARRAGDTPITLWIAPQGAPAAAAKVSIGHISLIAIDSHL